MRIVFRLLVLVLLLVDVPALAQQRSAKRGICWDDKNLQLTDATIQKMSPGVSWVYNWGVAPTANPSLLGSEMSFLPMTWNGDFDETKLRNYLTQHPGVTRYLLAFNEPNLSWNVGGAQMTPQQAANVWAKVEQVAADFDLQIVAPALNFSGDKVGDRVWEPFAWYDEFFRLVPNARVDYLCFHSYMNYYSAVNWVASEYFYTDKEDSDLMTVENRAKYPYLVAFMDNYKTAHGHYPRMFLTEFCSWETNSYPYQAGITRDFQIDQMTQKLQKLEQSDMVAGYAWFMGNVSGGYNSFPYMSIFQTNTAGSDLSELGKVYVYMSSFDAEKWYGVGEQILAKDYINASLDDQQPLIRSNSESGSTIPLQVEWKSSSWTAYQVTIPSDADYTLTLHMKSSADNRFRIYDGALGAAYKLLDTTLPSTSGAWQDVTTQVALTAGSHTLLLYNMGTTSLLLNSLRFDTTSGIRETVKGQQPQDNTLYDLQGRRVSNPQQAPKGIYVKGGKKFVLR